MTDDEIDCSDIPALTEEELNSPNWLGCGSDCEMMYLSIDKKLAEHFRKTGKGYLNRLSSVVNSLLLGYLNAHKAEGVV